MDQVHAQAYSLYKSGYRYWFDQDEIATVNEKNKEFMVSTTEDEFVAQYCTVLDSTLKVMLPHGYRPRRLRSR